MVDQEIETILNKATVFCKSLRNKDYLEIYYRKHLCKRLLLEKSANDESEKSMIEKLKVTSVIPFLFWANHETGFK